MPRAREYCQARRTNGCSRFTGFYFGDGVFMRNFRIGLLLLIFSLLAGPALADKRVALVIGNASYRNVPKLATPENDAAAIGALLKNAGFDVVETLQNLSVEEMRRSLRE